MTARRPVPLVAALAAATVLTACSSPPTQILAPVEPPAPLEAAEGQPDRPIEGADVLARVTIPAGGEAGADAGGAGTAVALDVDEACGTETAFDEGPAVTQVVEVPWATTVTVVGERNDAALVVVCDYTPGGALVTTDPLTSTGTNRPVGNDYATRVGEAIGRVDIGIPDGAVHALYDLGEYTLGVDVTDLEVLRLHALEGGSAEEGFEMGEVTFLDADGTDVTPESVDIPEVIHGVPRDRGSAVPGDGDGAED